MARPMSVVRSPLSQLTEEGLIERREIKRLMRRTNRHASLRLLVWVSLLLATGSVIAVTAGTGWQIVALFFHGVVLVHHFSLQHECVHFTAFRSRWLNDLVGNVCGLIILLPHQFFRYEHCDHHTYTQIAEKDPERIPLPKNIREYLWYLSAVPYWRAKFSEIIRHAAGHISAAEKRFIPRVVYPVIVWEARRMLVLIGLLLLVCVLYDWWAPLWYWWLPVALGEPVMRAIRMTEHVGRPSIDNLRLNTRTNLVSWPLRFLCWNMNFHAEHHYAASVPFHALPALHQRLKNHLTVEVNGYWGAHRAILKAVRPTRAL